MLGGWIMSMQCKFKIAIIPGDGIGKEVLQEGQPS
jgi:isocitrate/isopropylmalate dehydrogenase